MLADEPVELLVIGGGITGAGIALDAITRGIKTALIDKHDFAYGTSSRSTKLIHGGLRYLKQFDLWLVRETGLERAVIHRNAPHIVKPANMLLPITKTGSLGKFSTSIGLWLYDWLANVKKEERRKMLSRTETLAAEPLLRKDHIIGGGLYKEYITDDARLTIEVLKTAARRGALCVNYVKANGFVYHNGKIVAVKATDQLTREIFEIKARHVVNAAGPWVDELRQADGSLKGKKLHLTKGIHVVIPYARLPLQQAVYFDVSDGRMMFAIPRGAVTYIGTTDTTYAGNPDFPYAEKKDVEYVLSATNAMFPMSHLKPNDVISTWAGLRPLIHQEGKAPSELSRRDEIFLSESGLISIAGGKLTGFRKMAQRVVDLVAKLLATRSSKKYGKCITDRIVLSGGDFPSSNGHAIAYYKQQVSPIASRIGINKEQAERLVDCYGTHAIQILEKATQLTQTESNPTRCLLLAELDYGICHEMVTNLNDFLIRRTGRLYFERDSLPAIYHILKPYAASVLQWTEQQAAQHEAAFFNAYEEVMRFSGA